MTERMSAMPAEIQRGKETSEEIERRRYNTSEIADSDPDVRHK